MLACHRVNKNLKDPTLKSFFGRTYCGYVARQKSVSSKLYVKEKTASRSARRLITILEMSLDSDEISVATF